MGTPKYSRGGSRLRTGGLALFGLAAIAAVIGLVLALNRAKQNTAAEPVAVAPTHAPASPPPSVIAFPPPAAPNPAEGPEAPAPGVPAPAPPDAGQAAQTGNPAQTGDKGTSRGEVRIYNNSTIHGLAARAAGDLSAAGWTVVEVGNFARGTIPTTTAYYQA
ncbi:MAG: LytR C-terminal domain-containing protein, partial [Candidatus Dormibacteria bacterium]